MAPDPNSPIRHFRADSPFINRPGLRKRMVAYRTIRSWGGHSAANLAQTGQRKFWQIEIGNFLRKTDKFCANRPHTVLARVVCRGTAGGFFEHLLWVAETWQGEFVICHFLQNRFIYFTSWVYLFHRPVTFLPLTACAQRIRLQCR